MTDKELINKILKLGNPVLYQNCDVVTQEEIPDLLESIGLMNELILACQRVYGFGRGIAAPQIGVLKRIICLNLKGERHTIINPEFSNLSEEMMELWDDCMSFPNLLVRLKRHRSCTITYRDLDWKLKEWHVENDLSELLQHEFDHLNGMLATQRAIDNQSFKWKNAL